MEITLGWWLVPLLITVIGYFCVPEREGTFDINPLLAFLVWLVVSLFSWLVWAIT